MPIYAYRCEDCGFEKDVLQKLSDAPLTDCPHCHAPRFVKQVTAAGFQLKGSGWYATDFRNSGNNSGSKPGKAGSGEGASSGSPSAASPSAEAGGGCGAPACGTGGCGSSLPS